MGKKADVAIQRQLLDDSPVQLQYARARGVWLTAVEGLS